MQAEKSVAGAPCYEVARAVHEHQIANDMQHLVYHRPGHGEGVEGHQDPYHALGNSELMEEGMMFSNEPGLYDVDNGFGYNHSNQHSGDRRARRANGVGPMRQGVVPPQPVGSVLSLPLGRGFQVRCPT